jgi:hypothetical protein
MNADPGTDWTLSRRFLIGLNIDGDVIRTDVVATWFAGALLAHCFGPLRCLAPSWCQAPKSSPKERSWLERIAEGNM